MPQSSAPAAKQAVVVQGLVRAMEAADAPMHDAGRHAAPVVGGDSDGPRASSSMRICWARRRSTIHAPARRCMRLITAERA